MNRQFFDEYRKGRYLNLADVSSTTARGTSYTGYRNQGTMFSGQLSDAAKAVLVALSSVEEAKVGELFEGLLNFIQAPLKELESILDKSETYYKAKSSVCIINGSGQAIPQVRYFLHLSVYP